MFPISDRDPDCMEKFAYTDTETLLWDYSETEEHYVLVIPPARRVRTLYRVTQVYAYQWFGINGGNNLKIIYYPFAQTHFRNLTNPCDCPPESVEIFASISVAPSSVLEDSGTPMIYTVTLDIASLYDTTVNFTLTGTATEGVDYTAVTHSVTITAGQTTGTFAIHPIADASFEPDETVIATLTTGTSGVNVVVISTTNYSAIGTIIDDDILPVTWDPLSVERVVLSNSNLTNTNGAIFNDNRDPQGAIVTGVLSSGKYYFEIAYAKQDPNVFTGLGFGIGSAGGNYSGFNYAPGAYGAVVFGPAFFSGVRQWRIWTDTSYNGIKLFSDGNDGDGDVFGIAANLDTGKVWFQVVSGPDIHPANGWNGVNGDPVAGTGGVTIPSGLKSIFGTWADNDTDASEALTLNLGTSPFVGSVPTGYTAGWASTAFVPSVTGATWSSATATNVTLSNSNLTATNNLDGPGLPGGSRGTITRGDSNRYYFEITCTQPSTTSVNTYLIGIGSGIFGFANHASGGVATDRLGVINDNGVQNGDALNLSSGLQAGDVIGVAVDLISQRAWFAVVAGPSWSGFTPVAWAGLFHTSTPPQSPGANFQGAPLPGGPLYPMIAFADTDNTQVATFNLSGPFVGNPSVIWSNPFSSVGGTATRSNGNLTVTATNGNAVAVTSSGGHFEGPSSFASYWFEITIGATYAGTNTGCGICNYLFEPFLDIVLGKGAYSFLVDAAGDCWYRPVYFVGPGTTGIALGAILPGDVLQFAVKLGTTSQIWVRVNRGGVPQNWNANPAASPFPAVGGFDITALFNDADVLNGAFVFQAFASNGSSSTVNFGQSTFVTNPPIFPAWSNTFGPWGGTLDPLNTIESTLSNGNLTVTNAYPAIAEQGVTVATASGKTSGKYYFEVTITIDMDGDAAIGVAVAGSDYVQFNVVGTGGVAVLVFGDVFANGVYTGYSLSLSQVDRVGVAVDLDNRMVWVKTVDGSDYYKPSDWNGESIGFADPATNLNGIPLVAGTIVPIVAFSGSRGDDAGNALTINTGQRPFAGLTPVGFTAGWPA